MIHSTSLYSMVFGVLNFDIYMDTFDANVLWYPCTSNQICLIELK